MRLVCPNCDAEYEVDIAAIPDGGRDVQCSNCGHAWFQLPPAVEAELAAEEALFTPPPAEEPPVAGSSETGGETAAGPVTPPPAAGPRNIDDSVLAVLREEAEREVAQRRAEAPQAIETQPDLGLEVPPSAAVNAATARRIARMKGVEPPPPPEPEKPVARRDLLPEIDEINSTLRAASEKRSGEAAAVAENLPPPRPRRGFRNGFLLALVVAGIGLTAYAMAPRLSQQFPAAAPALGRYVASVDQARVWLDGRMQGLIGMIRGFSGADGDG
jgi:predicted Zn finger-like uncharacterized protein